MQSVSLWAEATWYRLGGAGRPDDGVTSAVPAESDLPAEPAPVAERVETDVEKVLVSR